MKDKFEKHDEVNEFVKFCLKTRVVSIGAEQSSRLCLSETVYMVEWMFLNEHQKA